MNTLADRLALAMKEAQVSAAELARACGVQPPSVSDWLSGKTKQLRGTNLHKAAERLSVSVMWLGEGRGPMRKGEPALSGQMQIFVTSEEVRLVEMYGRLLPRQRRALAAFLKEMLKED